MSKAILRRSPTQLVKNTPISRVFKDNGYWFQPTHGMCHTRVYYAWKNMMNRCYRAATRGYEHYGGRGIGVCLRWHVFENFLADMGEPPQGMSLERDKADEGYSKGNCSWATRVEQTRNRRITRMVLYKGNTLPLAVLAEQVGIPYKRLHQRLSQGIPLERALNTDRLKKNGNP